ncbi:MAG: InlB B-repeat-containing protein [Peptoniphilus grossensis]|uniref:InlB B-repeat-containing protein n=1 Tax=Peptoniphilus grossensis TaxID=1465756 RepID=UPI0025893633|nr:InlB B-repeat-containing protein [Peptoniphilus grossensis]MDU5099082.1 InlB B-repeat-containing protein [Peptoniphilus grossensis]
MKNYLKRTTTFILALLMLLSVPLQAFAQVNHEDLTKDKAEIINKKEPPLKPAKLESGQTAEELIKNPKQPEIYTLRTDYKVQRGEKYEVDYQPYIASVGEAATKDEQKKINKTVKLPDLAGYDKSQLDDSYTIDYDTVKNTANGNNKTGDPTNGIRYQANEDFRYKSKANDITIKHVFQDLEDFSKYTNPDGTVGEEGQLITTQNGNTGSTMEVSPLNDNHPNRKGFVPEAPFITMQVPENAENFILEYRYNRAHYDVVFDTAGGTPVPSRTLYYEQTIPKIAEADIPKKEGCIFQGWKPSVELKNGNGKIFKADEIIKYKEEHTNPVNNLDVNLKMPASNVTFTAVWKDKEKADYAIQFWVEKSDHADDASLMDKYEYMGTRVYNADTGSIPNLDAEPVNGLKFPDLDQARLNKIWANARFNRSKDLYLNKFFVYNQALTADQNKDPANVNQVKSVEATGKTVYNIYYDRQVYDLYFTKSNAQPEENTFYPEIWQYDEAQGEAVMKGGPGNLYHYKARFNEMMYKWPNDAKQTKGFTPGYQSFGWGPNYKEANWPIYLDTPPYRLNADEFLDMANYTKWGGYTKNIDKGDGTTKDLDTFDFTTLSFGIKQDHPSIPHHMDFWMDGFKPGETIIRYDLVRTKADTIATDYGHRYPKVTGFTPRDYEPGNPQSAWPVIREGSEENGRVNEDGINDLNDERDEITPNNCGSYYNNQGIKLPIGQLDFIPAFYSDQDDFGDVKEGGQEFTENGYLQFHYKRNKYPLRFNYDPSIIRDDSYFNSKNQLDTFYEFPLKALSPDLVDDSTPQADREYFKDKPANLLDNPENLQQLGLTELVFNDPNDNNKLKVKRPDNLSDQMVFKGWALDPAGTKLIWENPKETMPTHALNLYAKWGEPDYQWKVTFDPNGGNLRSIKEENLTTSRKTIQVGDIVQDETKTFPIKETNDGNKQVFTVIQRQKLVEPNFKPTRKGYDFMGWEVIRYQKDEKGDYTDKVDNSYRDTYKVPELYSFGNGVVSPIYLKAIWVPNQRVDVKIEHYFLDDDYKLDENEKPNPKKDTLEDKRSGYLVAATGDRQDDEYILAPHDELKEKLTDELKTIYEEYNKRVGLNNTFFQTFRVEPEMILNTETNQMEKNPKAENNVFKFFYRPFRKREYKVNYIDERFKGKETEKGAAIIDQEIVKNGNRHFDARNYRPIPGWKLVSDPQQQLFFDVNEETNEFLGINETGKKEITFYYKDVRVIEVPGNVDPPEGYVRVTFKADKGGSFGKDAQGNDITELNYDVIKGLKSDLLPVPQEWVGGKNEDGSEKQKEKDKYYITPDDGKKFTKWDNSPLLNDNTIINEAHTFTAYFEWSGLSATGLVRTEAFKDPNGTWTNNFAPTIDQLKKQLEWREKDVVKLLPTGAKIQFFDPDGKELTKDDQIYDLVNEKKAADKDQLVRTVNIKAKVTFKDGKDPQELDIPITVYKNVYEALNKEGHKPLFLTEAEKKDAKDGGLKDILKENTENRYIRVTVKPNKNFDNKDDKVYYVNPNAWVEIPEVKTDGDSNFTNWTADKAGQNEESKENGIFDFSKRHKFTEDTIITPVGAGDVVEQTDPNKKPPVPDSYVKVIVDKTTKAELGTEEKQTQTFWVNPTKEVTIPVTEPTGKTDQEIDIPNLGKKKVNYVFNEWQKVKAGEADDNLQEVKPAEKIDLSKNQYTDKITVIEAAYKKSIQAGKIEEPLKTTKLDTPQGKEITNDDLIKQITPQEGKEIESIEVISKPDGNTVGNEPAKVIVKYKDGSTQGTNDNPVVIPVEVHEKIVPANPDGTKPEKALENYVKVIFKEGTGGTVSGDLVYYVSPEVEVNMTTQAEAVSKNPSIGYTANGGSWSPEIKSEKITEEKTYEFNFVKSKDIVEKTDDPNQVIPEGYVKVTFKTEDANKGKLEGDKEVKIYYVNPKAEIKLVKLADGQTAGEKELAVPKTLPAKNYVFDKWQESIDEENPITNDRTHVAMFQSGQVTLTYKKGGEDVTGELPANVSVNVGAIVVLAGPGNLAKENSKFEGWKLDEDETIYQPGDQVKLEKSRTATAQWTSAKHTVTFNTMGGSDVPKQEVVHGGKLTNVTPPTLKDKVFMGWKEEGKDEFFKLDTAINEDKTLIAQWQDPVQKINDGDPVEDQFIKVTFLKGAHGTLKEGQTEGIEKVTYKVAKDLTFDKAQQAGLKVPEILPAKYYKVKQDQEGEAPKYGWDKALDLTLATGETEKIFTALYEPEADVIPVEPGKTDTQIEEEKPEGMVLVTFKVSDDNKFYLVGNAKYYVKKYTEVRIPTPVVLEKNIDDVFKGWQDVNLVNESLDPNTTDPNATKLQWVKQKFSKDTVISDQGVTELKLVIDIPRAGEKIVYIKELSNGATGKLEVISGSGSKTYDNTTYKRRGKTSNVFKLDSSVQSGDILKYWAEDGSRRSLPREDAVE